MTLPSQSLDDNSKFIIACAINLYIESRRRIDGRSLMSKEDVDPLLSIAEALITKRPIARMPDIPKELTEEEQAVVQNVEEQVIERVERRA